MDESFGSRLKHAWNAFMNRSPTYRTADYGASYSYRPDRPRLTRGNERSIVTSVYNRIAMDVAAISIQHVRLDANGRFLSAMDSGLNRCLTLEANLDQTGRGFVQDIAMSMMDEGVVAIVPVDTTVDPKLVAANIREGVTILGVEGTMSGSENMKPQAKTVTPSTSTAQQVLPDEGYNCLSQVTVNKIPYTESDNAAGGKTVTIG